MLNHWAGLFLTPFGLVGVLQSFPSRRCRRNGRGYSFIVWLVAWHPGPESDLPAGGARRVAAPQAAEDAEQFRKEVDAKLAAEAATIVPGGPIPERSLGDQPTVAPGFAAATDELMRSVGDAVTVVPLLRSLGDEVTRP